MVLRKVENKNPATQRKILEDELSALPSIPPSFCMKSNSGAKRNRVLLRCPWITVEVTRR